MARPSELEGRRLRAGAGRLRAAVGRHRGHLLVGLALTDLTLATTAVLALGSRSLGVHLALAVATVPAMLVNSARYCLPLSANVAKNVSVGAVAPRKSPSGSARCSTPRSS